MPLWQFADLGADLARAFGIFDGEEGASLRGTFIVDPANVVRPISVNDFVGRNPAESLRVLDALQTNALCVHAIGRLAA
nr:redoxin domain-containing protein [Caulobacter sp.]